MKRVLTAFTLALFFTIQLPLVVFGATTTDGVDITLTVTEAAVPAPTPSVDTGGGGGGPIGTPETILILNVVTDVGTSTTLVHWETNKPAVSTFSWGTTTEYTLGTLSEVTLVFEHQAFLDSLIPETKYFYRITADDKTTGVQAYVGNFTTLSLPDEKPPANITNFTATPGEDRIDLSWDNPPDPDFTEVRIVRSETFYPENPFDGTVIYEGPGEHVIDRDVVPGVTYYYSAFAHDEVNYSEGSITRSRLIVLGVPLEVIPPFEEFPPAPEVSPELQKLTLLDFDFIQDGKKIPHEGLVVPIDGAKDLTISVDYEKLPEVLKTIAFTLVDPEDNTKRFSFLLRVTPGKDTFQTTIAPLSRGGTYDMFINILDHKNQGLRKLQGELLTAAAIVSIEPPRGLIEILHAFTTCFALLVILTVIFLLCTVWNIIRKDIHTKNTTFFIFFSALLVSVVLLRRTFFEEYSCTILVIVLFLLAGVVLYQLMKKLFHHNTDVSEKDESDDSYDSLHLRF